jgi:hypothetical protein
MRVAKRFGTLVMNAAGSSITCLPRNMGSKPLVTYLLKSARKKTRTSNEGGFLTGCKRGTRRSRCSGSPNTRAPIAYCISPDIKISAILRSRLPVSFDRFRSLPAPVMYPTNSLGTCRAAAFRWTCSLGEAHVHKLCKLAQPFPFRKDLFDWKRPIWG